MLSLLVSVGMYKKNLFYAFSNTDIYFSCTENKFFFCRRILNFKQGCFQHRTVKFLISFEHDSETLYQQDPKTYNYSNKSF